MTNSAFSTMDARLMRGFANAGMADVATYTAPSGGSPLPCTVMIDRDVQTFGDYGQVVGSRVTVQIQLAEVADPKRGGTLTIGAESWKLESETHRDESIAEWILNDG